MSITELNGNEEYDRFLQQHQYSLIFFGSDSCPHCHEIAPFVEELAHNYPQLAVAHIEVTRVEVKGLPGVPVFLLYQGRQVIGTQVGADEEKLWALLQEQLGLE